MSNKFKLQRTNRESIQVDSKPATETKISPTVVESLKTDRPYTASSMSVSNEFNTKKSSDSPIEARLEDKPRIEESSVETAGISSSVLSKVPRKVQSLRVVDCSPCELFQPRTHFDMSELQSLADNMKKLGQVQPIIVVKESDKYLIVSGERRYRAAKLNDFEFIDAVVLPSRSEAVEIAYFDNEARSNLSFIEKLVYWRKLLDSGWASSYKEISERLGVDYQFVARASKVHLIPDEVKTDLIRTKAGRPAVVRALQGAEKIPSEKESKKSEVTTIKFSVDEKNGIPLTLKGLGSVNIKTLEYIVSEASRMIKNLK